MVIDILTDPSLFGCHCTCLNFLCMSRIRGTHFNNSGFTEIRTWMSNHMHNFMWDVKHDLTSMMV